MLLELLREKMDSTFKAVNATVINFDLMVENLLYYNDFKDIKYKIAVNGNVASVEFIDYGISMTMIARKGEYGILEYTISEVIDNK